MNLLLSCIGRRGYLADWFREQLGAGGRIIGTSNTRRTSGFHACDLGVVLPDVASEAYIPALLDLCRAESIHAVLSFLDEDVMRLAAHRAELVALGVTPFLPDLPTAELCTDKVATAGFLRERGLPSPAVHVDLAQAMEALSTGGRHFPVIVKPRRGAGSRAVFAARDERELELFMGLEPGMMAQELLRGEEHGIDVLTDLEGNVVSVVVKRKIRMRAGETDQAVTVQHEGALRLGERLGELLGPVGPLDVDVFIDGEEVTVLELNARIGAGYPFSHAAGADWPRMIVAMTRGERVEPRIGQYEVGVEGMKETRAVGPWTGPLVDRR